MEIQEIIRCNSRWRVGNGNTIQIWKDRWLPNRVDPMVSSIPFPYLENATVSSIKKDQGSEWMKTLFMTYFLKGMLNLF